MRVDALPILVGFLPLFLYILHLVLLLSFKKKVVAITSRLARALS